MLYYSLLCFRNLSKDALSYVRYLRHFRPLGYRHVYDGKSSYLDGNSVHCMELWSYFDLSCVHPHKAAIFMERFILTLHYQSHAPIFPRGDIRNSFVNFASLDRYCCSSEGFLLLGAPLRYAKWIVLFSPRCDAPQR